MINVTITGNLTDGPRTFTIRDGQPGCELRVAVDLPGRNGDGVTRYFKVVSFGVLASHAAAPVRKGDRVTVQAYDLISEAWVNDAGEPRGKVAMKAIDLSVSIRWDTLTIGKAIRNAAREAAKGADPQVQAERAVVTGVTRS